MKKRLLLFLFLLIVVINVSANSAPIFNENKTGQINLKEYETFNYQLNVSDADNDDLTFIDLSNLTNFNSFEMNSSGYINFKVNYNDIGYYPVILIVIDTSFDADIITWNFNISNSTNIPPNVTYEPNNDVVLSMNENESKKFNVNSSDKNNDVLTSRWLLDNSEKSSNTSNYIYITNFSDSGEHNIKFEVNDGNVSVYVQWNIIVNDTDLVPYLIKPIENISIPQNNDYSFNLNEYFADDDRDKLSYIAALNPIGNISITVNNDTGEVFIEPDNGFIGEKELTFTAKDSGNHSVSSTINLSVYKIEESSTYRGEDADNKKKKSPVTEQNNVKETSNKITGEAANLPKENKIIETILEKAGFNNDMFKKPNISWGIIGSLIIVVILIELWIKVRINRRKNFGF